MSEFRIVIPARYASTRLPGKPLRVIHGKTMIQWVYESASESDAIEIVVATDDQRIYDTVAGFGGQVCMTSSEHQTGSDRILEVSQKNKWSSEEIIVNLQGDEPLMPSANLNQVAEILARSDGEMSTLYKNISKQEALNPNLVKLVTDCHGYALYFSRSIIPFDRDEQCNAFFGHIGIYAYRAGFLSRFSQLPVCELENAEKLEQLRALWNGYRIKTAQVMEVPGPGIDTEEDLQRVTELLDRK